MKTTIPHTRSRDPIAHRRMDLIHYGDDALDIRKFKPICDAHWIKPEGGLWASPVDTNDGWRQWCESEDFHKHDLEQSFRFTIEGKVFTVDGVRSMNQLSWIDTLNCISFETLLACGVDAVYLTAAGQWATRLIHPRSLYGWDCECVLVMNPDCIVVR